MQSSLGLATFLLALAVTPPALADKSSSASERDLGKVALLPLHCERGIAEDLCAVLGDSVAIAIAESAGLEPISPGDLEVMMGAQTLAELSSCGDGQCFVGDESLRIDAAWLLGGTVTRLGNNTRVVMRLVDLARGAIVERGEVSAPMGDEQKLDTGVRRLTFDLLLKRGLVKPAAEGQMNAAVVVEEDPPYLLYAGGVTAGLGLVALAGAGVFGVLAYIDVVEARAAPASELNDKASAARAKANGADLLLATGGVLLVGGLVLGIVGAL